MSLNEELEKHYSEAKVEAAKRLFEFGDKLAAREGYKELSGLNAVYYYLIQKHHWLPSQVKSLSVEDLAFCLEEETF